MDRIRSRRTPVVETELSPNPPTVAVPAHVPAPNTSPLVALSWFEHDPRGVIHWLAQQHEGQPPHLVRRWAACIQQEARLRLAEVTE